MTEELLARLRARASSLGTVLAREAVLLEDLRTNETDLSNALAQLQREGYIEVLTPGSFLVLKLKKWSGSISPRVQEEQQITSNRDGVHKEVPVSSAAAAALQQEDGGAGEGEALLDEVLHVLGPDADREEFRDILAGRDPSIVYRCLKRVQATMAIRVSRAALFRSLLQKLSD